jgi:hypothetical protein
VSPPSKTPALSSSQEGQDGQDPTVIVGHLLELELREDLGDVGLDRLRTEGQCVTDPPIRAAFGYKGEHLALSFGQLGKPVSISRTFEQPRDDRRVDHALALRNPLEGIGQHGHIRNAFLQEISNALGMLVQNAHRIPRLEIVGQDEDADPWMGVSNLLGRD